MLLSSKMQVGTVAVGMIGALVVACASEPPSEFTNGGPDAGSSSFVPENGFGPSNEGNQQKDDLYANDPPPPWCGPGGDPAPPPPGGTLECPDDKNKPGCGCSNEGEKAACWTGLRKHRNVGVCKDGETTCRRKSETGFAWGPCEGEVLPVSGATKGKEACTCFSAGQWKLANLSPCTMSYTEGNKTTISAVSTILKGNSVECPAKNPPTAPPAEAWSTSTLNVDCAGHFKLCLRIRHGSFENPSPNDCIIGESCAEGDYKTPNEDQQWPDLPGWLGKDTACAKKWYETPDDKSAGYAEMIVKGQSVRCDPIDDGAGNDLVFNRVKFCPSMCNEPANANHPECVSCRQGGQGDF